MKTDNQPKRQLAEAVDLAFLGDEPAFDATVHVGQPNIGDRDRLLALISRALDRRWPTNNGPLVQEFERRVDDQLGVQHCIAVCNATIGRQIVSRALDLSGEVIIPSFTFCVSAQAWHGAV